MMAKVTRTNILKPVKRYCHKKEYKISNIYYLEVMITLNLKQDRSIVKSKKFIVPKERS